MMSFAAYLSGVRLISRTFIYDRVIYMLVYIIFTLHVLLINTSTTGYVVYFLLMGLWFVQHTSRMQMLLGAIFLTAILSLGLIYSNVMYVKASQTISELKIFHTSNKPKLRNTSLGYRMQFHAYAKKLYLRHPWIGNGTGSFTRLYAIEGPIPAWSWRLTEPHSQYWLVASEWGLLGCLGLFAFFLSLFFAAFRLTNMRSTAIALLISFMACCLTDSFLLYSGTGYFFILMMALCLGEY